jgi:prepilin-type N-terminal cleavage/methylation domain-containing protein
VPDPARGFSLLELVVVIAIISLLMVVAIQRLMAMRVDAERVAMEVVLGALRSAIGIRVAESIVKHDMAALRALDGSNPMDRLSEVPKNYLGELDNPNPAALENGNWYFDRSSRALVYLPQHAGYFAGGLPEPPRARFAIKLVYTDKNKNGVWDAGAEAIEGLRLTALEPYRWLKSLD